jgi:hypothetical protein
VRAGGGSGRAKAGISPRTRPRGRC